MIKTYSLKKDGNKKITAHFKVREFKCSSSDVIKVDTDLVNILEKVHKKFNCKYIIINSGYRTKQHDISVGGSGKGQHTLGRAADFKCMGQDGNWISAKKICCYLEDINCKGIAYINSRSVHLDTRTGNKYWGDETKGYNSIWYYKKGCYSFYKYFNIKKRV